MAVKWRQRGTCGDVVGTILIRNLSKFELRAAHLSATLCTTCNARHGSSGCDPGFAVVDLMWLLMMAV